MTPCMSASTGKSSPRVTASRRLLPTWAWSNATMDGVRATIEVPTAGTHTVNVWMREDGFVFDKLVLTFNAAFTPTETGPAESPRNTPPGSVAVNSFTATPDAIIMGNAATLAWTTTNATAVAITPGVGTTLAPDGSVTVQPTSTTTYTLTATGTGGTATRQVTVSVTPPTPPIIVSFSATPDTTSSGGAAVLDWATTNATTVMIAPGPGGSLPTTGSITVNPTATTTYILTATGLGGVTTRSVVVTIVPPPVANFNASPTSGTAFLTVGFTDTSRGKITSRNWNFGDGTTSTLKNPSHRYKRAGTYTVSLTVTGPGGSNSASRTNLIVVKSADESDGTFKQGTGANGVVAMEAEHAHTNTPQGEHSWSLISPTGASGTGAMEATPNAGTTNTTDYAANSPRLDFQVTFVRTGTHYVWVRGLGPSGVDDSVHVGLNGQELATSDRISTFAAHLGMVERHHGWCPGHHRGADCGHAYRQRVDARRRFRVR